MKWTVKLIEDKNSMDKNFVEVLMEGDFNSGEHLQMIEDIISRQFWKAGMNILLDSRKVSYKNTDINVMRQAGENMSKFDKQIGRGKAAVLMGSIFTFGKGRQFEMLAEEKVSPNVRIFLDEAEALSWLII